VGKILAITEKELKSYFVSPIAYVVMMIFLIITGYFFYGNIIGFQSTYSRYQTLAQIYKQPQILERLNLNTIVIEGLLFNIIFILLFLMPAIMMRSFSEEKRNGTEELLMTSPVTVNQIIAGKFFGSFIFMMVLILPTVIYQILLFSFAKPELGPVLTGYLGIIGFICVGIAVGLFASSLTKNQIIAMVISFVFLLMLFIIGMVAPAEGTAIGEVVRYLSVASHAQNLMRGLIDTKDIIYFASLTILFIFLTKQSVDSVRWR
jgi:ABC-2 type transport system permease protein